MMNDGRQLLIQILWEFPILFLLMSGMILTPLSGLAQGQQNPAGDETAYTPNQLHSVSGTILIRDEFGTQIFYLDTDGDGTGDYQLEFTSPEQRTNLPEAGHRVKVTGRVHGLTLAIIRIQEQ